MRIWKKLEWGKVIKKQIYKKEIWKIVFGEFGKTYAKLDRSFNTNLTRNVSGKSGSKIRKKFLKKIEVKWKNYLENLEKFVMPFLTIVQTDGRLGAAKSMESFTEIWYHDLIVNRLLIAYWSLYSRLTPTCDKKITIMGFVYITN